MAFDSFSIRKIAENSIIDIDEIDSLVRDEFSLKDHDIDKAYGHFYFTESDKELGGFQKSISWVRLIHSIIYYSNIGCGYRDVYEILAALYETKNGPGSQVLLIQWPASTFEFTAKLIQFLKDNGLYVYVEYDDSSPDASCENLSHSKSILKSESGLFECDANGRLMNYYIDINIIDAPSIIEREQSFKHRVISAQTIIIPEGITHVPCDFFRMDLVKGSIVYPKTLTALGSKSEFDNLGFSIREKESNNDADINVLDEMICKVFGLTNLNPISDDYGHFKFPESINKAFERQESMSWVSLLHCIAYYSCIRYGRRSKNEIIGALYEMLTLAIKFPYSLITFTSKLLDYLDQEGLYVFFEYTADRKTIPADDKIYINRRNHSMYICCESGLFMCDEYGMLKRFYPSIHNILNEQKVRETYTFGKSYYKPCVHSLIIPEGVTSLEHDFFRGGYVKDQLHFPRTLVSLGDELNPCVFADSCLPDIIIPDNVRSIGEFAFGNSHIKSLRLTRVSRCEYLRQFKGAYIGTLFLPKECQQQWQHGLDGYAFLHDNNNVEFY